MFGEGQLVLFVVSVTFLITSKRKPKARLNHTSPLTTFKNAYVAGEGSDNQITSSTQVTGGMRRRSFSQTKKPPFSAALFF